MENKRVSLPVAVFTLALVAGTMAVGLAIIKLNAMVTFVLSLILVCIVAICNGMKLDDLQETLLVGCRKASLAIMIMMTVGMIIGTWIISGIIPSIVYYGLRIFTPSTFLLFGFLTGCIVSFFTGSSYAVIGTLGVAFIAIGHGMGVNLGLVAGMIVSGAVFGDKMSPFSDTTIMASAACNVDIFTHIRSMIWTIVPAVIISCILYYILGLGLTSNADDSMGDLNAIVNALAENFTISPFLLAIPAITVMLVIMKMPPLIALVIGALSGIAAALTMQPQFTVRQIINSLGTGFSGSFEVKALNTLLNRGGISSMMSVVAYSLFALSLGEVMSSLGILDAILDKLKEKILKPRNLITATVVSCLFTTLLTTSQYMSIILPSGVFQEPFKKAKVAPYVLSRTVEDGGTIFCFLVPWATAGIFTTGALGVATLDYLPYAFLCLACPIFAIIYAYTGFGVYDINGNSLRGKTHQVVD